MVAHVPIDEAVRRFDMCVVTPACLFVYCRVVFRVWLCYTGVDQHLAVSDWSSASGSNDAGQRLEVFPPVARYMRQTDVHVSSSLIKYCTSVILAVITDRISWDCGRWSSHLRLFFCPSICFHSIFWTDCPWTWVFVCLWATTVARLGLKIKVIGPGGRAESSACRHGMRSVWPQSLIEDS